MVRRSAGYVWLLATLSLLAIGLRLMIINQPFTDSWSWRQSDVAAIARNYLHTGFHFAYPQIDWSGTATGYVGTEFPILPFTAAICYKVVGVREWVGRGQSLLFFVISLPFFVAVVRQVYGELESVWALAFYSFAPLNVMASRCFMPDVPSLSLSLVGLYCFVQWLQTGKWLLFLLAAIATSSALLIKLPTAIIGAPLACLALERFGGDVVRRPALWLFGALVLIPSIFWYWHAADVANQYYPHHLFGDGGIRLMSWRWYAGIGRRTVMSSLTPVLCGLAVTGLLIARKRGASALFYWWLAAVTLFTVVAGYGNRHPWYQLPLVPIAAVFGGCALAGLQRKLQKWPWLVLAGTVLMMSLFALNSYTAARSLSRPAAADLQSLGLALKQHTPAGSLIVVADYGDPTALYYAERKGWHFLEKDAIYNGHPTTSADAIDDLEHLRHQQASYVAFYSGTNWWLDYYSEFGQYLAGTSTLIEKAPAYEIFQLKP